MGDKLDLRTEPISRVNVSNYNMKIATLFAFVAVLPCQFSLAQTPAQQEVLQFERDACKAFLEADVVALEPRVDDRFYAHPFKWRRGNARR